MRIFVTGSEGMVGRTFVYEARRRGHKVLGIDKKNGDKDDITKTEINFVGDPPDVIVHLAATCSTIKGLDNPEEAFNDNAFGSLRVAECARKYHIPVIYTSSIKAQQNGRGQRTPYGLTKFMGEEILEEWGVTYGLRYIINRPGTMYGPFQDASSESGWLGWFIKAAVESKPVTIYGKGDQKRDVLFVDDYVRLLIDQCENFDAYERVHRLFDVGGGPKNTLTIAQAAKHLDLKVEKYADARVGDCSCYIGENRLAKSIRGWEPKVDWQTGIEITKKYFERRANI